MNQQLPTISGLDGVDLPVIGLGTYPMKGGTAREAVGTALQVGYRLLDSAYNYENEGSVGKAIRESGIPRDEIVLASKLPGRHHERADALLAVEESVHRTGGDHIDLYLIHWPNPATDRFVEAWQALIEARERGWVRHIGVSNFEGTHLERLHKETGVLPAVNQIEVHPLFPQADLHQYHQDHGIITEAWGPLGRGTGLLDNPVLCEIADRHDTTSGAVVLAWHLQRGVLPLPKSSSPKRQAENLGAVDVNLTVEDMAQIGTLASREGRLGGDPMIHEEF